MPPFSDACFYATSKPLSTLVAETSASCGVTVSLARARRKYLLCK
jgi:hypothetical protein